MAPRSLRQGRYLPMIRLSKFANDLTGWRVGKLVAEYPVRRTRGSLNVVWFCRCDCGGSVERVGSLLWQSDWGLQHCGCERALPPSTVTATASEQEKAYFAGYTDAEGCIGIVPKILPYWSAYVSFNQTQPMVVERMHVVYGGGLSVRKRDEPRRLQKQLLIQRFSDVRRFLSDVIPYLREKRAQAEIVLNQFDLRAEHATNQVLLDCLVQLKACSRIRPRPMIPVKKQGPFEVFSRGVEEPWSIWRDGVPLREVWTWNEVEAILGGETASPAKAVTKKAPRTSKAHGQDANLFARATDATDAARKATAVADREGTVAAHRMAAKAHRFAEKLHLANNSPRAASAHAETAREHEHRVARWKPQ